MSRGGFWLGVLIVLAAVFLYVYTDQNKDKQVPPITAPATSGRSNPQPVIVVTATPLSHVASGGSRASTSGSPGGNISGAGVTTSNTSSSGPAGFSATCTNGAQVEEAGDGNFYMTSQPSQGYACDFTVQQAATRYWKGVNASLFKDGQQIQKGGNNIPIALTPGSTYRVVGGLNNGGFALQMNPTP